MPQLLEKGADIVQPSSEKASGNQLFPIFVKLNELTTLVVGGGNVGLEKLIALLDNSHVAKIKLIAERIRPEIYELAKQHAQLELIEKSFEPIDVEGVQLVLAATNDNVLNETIRQAAHERNLLINVADKPDLCDFYLGSIVKKGDLKIAISTNGKSPTIAKRLKQVLKENIPDEIDRTLQQMSALRLQLKGDFAFKVKQLNAVTASLVDEQDTFALPMQSKQMKANLKWFLWAVLVFSVVVGIFVFWRREPGFQSSLLEMDSFFYYFLTAGFGGGWGAIVLSNLFAGGRHPLFSLGTAKITVLFIAILSTITFISMLGGTYWEAVLGLVTGSSLAALIAAKVSNTISIKTIMVFVGSIVLIISLRNVVIFIMKIV